MMPLVYHLPDGTTKGPQDAFGVSRTYDVISSRRWTEDEVESDDPVIVTKTEIVRYPAGWLAAASAEDLDAIGITVEDVPDPDPAAAILAAADIEIAHRQVAAVADAMAAAVTGPVPETECASWPTKEIAARAYLSGTATAVQTGMLQAEADARGAGESLGDLAARIVANADAYVPIAGMIAGHRRRTAAAIDALVVGSDTRGDLDAVLLAARQQAEAMLAQIKQGA